jgi:hypothetical protein
MLYDCYNALNSYVLDRVHVVQQIWALMGQPAGIAEISASRLEFQQFQPGHVQLAPSLCSSRAHVTCPCFSPCACHIPAHTARPLPQLFHASLATTISSKTVHGAYPCPWSIPPYDPSHTCIPLVLYAYGPLAPRPICTPCKRTPLGLSRSCPISRPRLRSKPMLVLQDPPGSSLPSLGNIAPAMSFKTQDEEKPCGLPPPCTT